MKRRQFLQASGAGVVGGALFPDTVGAETYDHFVEAVTPRYWLAGNDDYNTKIDGTYYENWAPSASGDVLVWVHGWRSSFPSAKTSGEKVAQACAEEGWYPTVVTFHWDSWTELYKFYEAEDRAWQTSNNLAHLLDDLDSYGTTVHLGCHSLGARVGLEALLDAEYNANASYDFNLESLTLMGGAVDDDQIHDKFHTAVENHVDAANNFYWPKDQVLSDYYHVGHNRGGARAIGQAGAWSDADHSLPNNWNDYEVTQLTDHKYYYYPGSDGCMGFAVPPSDAWGVNELGGGGGQNGDDDDGSEGDRDEEE